MGRNISTKKIAQALYSINRHAKTAIKPQHLYYIKKETINQLLNEKRAKKIGLHFSKHPKLSNQHSTLLVKIDDYFFHILPTKEDFNNFKHLGKLDQNYRNPRTNMSLSQAKKIAYDYINYKPKMKQSTSSYYIPSSLGNIEWPPKR